MTQLVVDTSVVVKWFIAEVNSAEALRIYSKFQTGEMTLLAPDLIHAEVGNVIWRKQMFEGMTPSDAQIILADFQSVRIKLTSDANLLDEAYQLAVTHQCTVYDAMFLALSMREGCQFVTADEKLASKIGAAPLILYCLLIGRKGQLNV